ncbi:unnamed protein product, partial [Trichobilharzia szidati]
SDSRFQKTPYTCTNIAEIVSRQSLLKGPKHLHQVIRKLQSYKVLGIVKPQ